MSPILARGPFLRATVTNFFSAVFLAGNAAGAMVFGYVAHALGYGLMWAMLTALLLGGAILSVGLAESAARLAVRAEG